MFPFFNHYPGTDLHEIDLAYILKLCAELRASNTTLTTWKVQHEAEYADLRNDVDGLINNLVDVIVPWDSSIAYHVFSIVEYQGQNYIAIQDVPVGVMITNTDYWQPANTALEQINAMSVIVSDLQNSIFWITPEEYGAKGDGVTDDSAAFQAMFDDLPDSACVLLTANRYIIDSPITLRRSFVTISGRFGRNEYAPYLDFGNMENETCFTINASGVSLYNFGLRGASQSDGNTLLSFDCDDTTHNGNIDGLCSNLHLIYGQNGITCKGRNVRITETIFNNLRLAITLNQTTLSEENRGYEIKNNRVHYCYCFITNNIQNALTKKNITISSNFADGCTQFFGGYLGGLFIKNNDWDGEGGIDGRLFSFWTPSVTHTDYINEIRGNTFRGNDSMNQICDVPTYTNKIIIADNTFQNFGGGIQVYGTGIVMNNVFDNVANRISGARPAAFVGSGQIGCAIGNVIINGTRDFGKIAI